MTISFRVDGIPQPRGSKTAIPGKNGGRPWLIDDNKKSQPWMDAVTEMAAREMNGKQLLAGPLHLHAAFSFPRPKGHYGTGKNANVLKKSAPTWKESKPDCSKILRAIEDAMTGVVYRDDAQIAAVEIQKGYTEGSCGVLITVSELSPEPTDDDNN